jgi:hypothetical protein
VPECPITTIAFGYVVEKVTVADGAGFAAVDVAGVLDEEQAVRTPAISATMVVAAHWRRRT